MKAQVKRSMGFKSSCINASSQYAEREMDLSEIDSKYYNGELDKNETQIQMILWAGRTDNMAMLPVLFAVLVAGV